MDDVRREEKLKDIANTITNVNRWSSPCITDSLVVAPDEKPTRDENTVPAYQQGGGPKSQSGQLLRPQSLTIPSTAPAIVSAIVKKIPTGIGSTKSSELSTTSPSPKLKPSQTHERGDPDGDCGVDDAPASYLSKNSELRVNLPSEELLNSKKGWLMKQDSRTTEWSKHWFSLRGAALFYYRDPVAEEKGVLDGVLDVNSITSIAEVPVSRNYGFQLTVSLRLDGDLGFAKFNLALSVSDVGQPTNRSVDRDHQHQEQLDQCAQNGSRIIADQSYAKQQQPRTEQSKRRKLQNVNG